MTKAEIKVIHGHEIVSNFKLNHKEGDSTHRVKHKGDYIHFIHSPDKGGPVHIKKSPEKKLEEGSYLPDHVIPAGTNEIIEVSDQTEIVVVHFDPPIRARFK